MSDHLSSKTTMAISLSFAAILTTVLSSNAMAQFPGPPPGGPPVAFGGPPLPGGPGPAFGAGHGVAPGIADGAIATGVAAGAYAADDYYGGSCGRRYRVRYYDPESGTYIYRCRY